MAMIMFTILVVMVVLGNGLEVAVAANPCRRRCGSIDVPYPFGINGDHPSCYYSTDFLFNCSGSFRPAKLLRGDFEIVEVNISPAKVRPLMNISYDCYNASGGNDGAGWSIRLGPPYAWSYLDNVAVALGCDINAKVWSHSGDNFTVGCFSVCDSLDNVVEDYCSGLGCCQMSLPKGLTMLNFSLTSYYKHSRILDFNPCGYLFLVQKNNYTFRSSDLRGIPKTRLFPTVWDWYISENSCQEAIKNTSSYACISTNSLCLNSINGPGYVCNCSEGYQGNPYVH